MLKNIKFCLTHAIGLVHVGQHVMFGASSVLDVLKFAIGQSSRRWWREAGWGVGRAAGASTARSVRQE